MNLGPQGDDSPSAVVITDFAWVQSAYRNVLVFGASKSNDLVLVDLDDDNFRMTKLALTPSGTDVNGGSERQIEWAQGTNYVWVNARDTDELIVVELPTNNIDDARVAKTIPSHDQGDLIFVENFERMAAAQVAQELISQALEEYTSPTDIDSGTSTDADLLSASDDDDGIDVVSVVALVVSILGMLLGMFAVVKAKSAVQTAATTTSIKEESVTTEDNHPVAYS